MEFSKILSSQGGKTSLKTKQKGRNYNRIVE